MKNREHSLLQQIEDEALSDSGNVASALRKCVALGGRASSSELRDWASKELHGYRPADDLPNYRVVPAVIKINATTIRARITGQRISPDQLPDVVQEHVDEKVELRDPLGQLEDLIARYRSSGDTIYLSLPGGADVARMMNYEIGDSYQQIIDVYWSVDPSAVTALVDQVRTTLVELVAELRAGLDDPMAIPSAELAAQAVNVAVYGQRSRVLVNTAQSSADGKASVTPSEKTGWPLWRKIGAFIVGLATVVAAIVAVITSMSP